MNIGMTTGFRPSADEVASSVLALLIMDLGYDKQPVHGHHPIRHQLSWKRAVEALGPRATPLWIEFFIAEREKQKLEEPEPKAMIDA